MAEHFLLDNATIELIIRQILITHPYKVMMKALELRYSNSRHYCDVPYHAIVMTMSMHHLILTMVWQTTTQQHSKHSRFH